MDSPTLKEALNSSQKLHWIEAISEELESLREADTWENVPSAPPGKRVFPSKFVLKIKRNADRTVERYKARLVFMGNFQRQNIDFFETYSPVVDFTAVRTALTIACQEGMAVHHLDVKCAFLYGRIDEEIYMSLPEEYMPSDGSLCKLKKSIYGLKQAPRAWNERLTEDLKGLGYKAFFHAECIFWRKSEKSKVFLLVYVDDFLLITSATDESEIRDIKLEIGRLYTIKDLGRAEYFLGINLEISPGSIKLSQSTYIQNVLERFRMDLCKSVISPMLPKSGIHHGKESTEEEENSMASTPYREAIGALMFLSVRTRPDIAAAVGSLAMYVQKPRLVHWEGVKRVLRYLQGTKNEGLVINSVPPAEFTLQVSADADWASDVDNRRSRSGTVCQLGVNTIWWKSRKQTAVAASSCEAEYMALFDSAKDTVWLRNLLCEFGHCPGMEPTVIHHDNQGSIAWATSDTTRRAKHIALRYHFTHDLIQNGLIRLQYVASGSNKADCLTKPLGGSQFVDAKLALGVRN
jgi:hypothetical protein